MSAGLRRTKETQAAQQIGTYAPAAAPWQAATAYKAGQLATYSGALVSAKADFTSGASFDLANWNVVASPQAVTTFTASGTYSVPATVNKLRVVALGAGSGGGGGGSALSSGGVTNQTGGGGGGAGASVIREIDVVPGDTLTVTVGAGGAGGAGSAVNGNAGSNGTAGGDTTVTGSGVAVTAKGSSISGRGSLANSTATAGGGTFGQGGNSVTTVNGPGVGGNSASAGATAGGGPSSYSGGGGGAGGPSNSTKGGVGGSAGTLSAGGNNGGLGGSADVNGAVGGTAAANTGAGGGGGGAGSATGTGAAGGTGGSGLVIIEALQAVGSYNSPHDPAERRWMGKERWSSSNGTPIANSSGGGRWSAWQMGGASGATTQRVIGIELLPSYWATFDIEVHFANASTGTGNVVFICKMGFRDSADDLSASGQDVTWMNNQVVAAAAQDIETKAQATGGPFSNVAGKLLYLYVQRQASAGSASDTLANAINFLGVRFVPRTFT